VAAALAAFAGTVTEFLEHLAQEPVDADVVHAERVAAPPGGPLGATEGCELWHRAVLLTGRASGRAFVYAESVIAAERLAPPARDRLEQTADPIGRVLVAHGHSVDRRPLGAPGVPRWADGRAAGPLAGAVLSRRYRVHLDGVAAMEIAEWFLAPVADALSATTKGAPLLRPVV
jgi:chorismate-pyruvate lyase